MRVQGHRQILGGSAQRAFIEEHVRFGVATSSVTSNDAVRAPSTLPPGVRAACELVWDSHLRGRLSPMPITGDVPLHMGDGAGGTYCETLGLPVPQTGRVAKASCRPCLEAVLRRARAFLDDPDDPRLMTVNFIEAMELESELPLERTYRHLGARNAAERMVAEATQRLIELGWPVPPAQ